MLIPRGWALQHGPHPPISSSYLAVHEHAQGQGDAELRLLGATLRAARRCHGLGRTRGGFSLREGGKTLILLPPHPKKEEKLRQGPAACREGFPLCSPTLPRGKLRPPRPRGPPKTPAAPRAGGGSLVPAVPAGEGTAGQRDSRTEGQQEGSWLQHLLQEEAGAGSQQEPFVLSWKQGQELWSTLLCTSALSNHSCALSYSTQRVTERGQTLGSSRGV